jgi:predicted metal-dependent hydrolase
MLQRLLQFTLDLFEPTPRAVKTPEKLKKSTGKTDVAEQNQPKSQQIPDQVAPKNIAINTPLPTQTLQQALASSTFAHPRASRETLLDGIAIAYEFKRSKRRTIGFSVGSDGLSVSAPKWVPLYEIDKAVLEKSLWIIQKLQQARARFERLEAARIEWRDGTVLPFLGQQVIVVLDPHHVSGAVGAELKNNTNTLPAGTTLTLHVGLSHTATPDQIKDAVQAWLMRQAKRLFTERLNHFAPTLNVQWRKLSLSSAGTRWGSASADGSIRLNWRLIHYKPTVIDYVVVHELSHLRVMDHSPRFWDTVRAVVPDYAALRSQLKDDTILRW